MKLQIQLQRCGLLFVIFGIALLTSACVHPLRVKNLNEYRSMRIEPLARPLTVGVMSSASDSEMQQLVKGVGKALGQRSATVLMPYAPNSDKPADLMTKIEITPEYKGSGWNFLINWPGFLIWVPAWNGYVYKANFDVKLLLMQARDGKVLDEWSMPIQLDLRHAEIDRTWTEIGWLEWGVIPLIGGFVFIQYDTDVTPVLVEKIEGPIGDYIAQEIVTRINKSGYVPVYRPPQAPPAPPLTPSHPAPAAPRQPSDLR